MYKRIYYTEAQKRAKKKYQQSKKGKLNKKKVDKKYQQSKKGKVVHKESIRKWRQQNKERIKQYQSKYTQTEKGKAAKKRIMAKRKRNLGWILMFPNPFADNVLVDYHHITNVYVVAVPKDLHQLYLGKNHRENIMDIIKQIY